MITTVSDRERAQAATIETLRQEVTAWSITAENLEHELESKLDSDLEKIAAERYKVVPAHESMFHRWAVVAGDGTQQLYLGREAECQNMARKFAGAFLDGAYLARAIEREVLTAVGAAPVPSELVLTFNFGTLVKVVFQDRVLYEVDLSPKSYWQVCWERGWAGDYESEEEAREECLALCGYERSIREIKYRDDGYKDPHQPQLTEKRFLLAAAGAAPAAKEQA